MTRERKGQRVTDDLRPFVLSLRVDAAPAARPALLAELGTQPRAVRPGELLAAIDGDLVERAVCRLQQWITHEGARREPLAAAADADSGPHAGAGPMRRDLPHVRMSRLPAPIVQPRFARPLNPWRHRRR